VLYISHHVVKAARLRAAIAALPFEKPKLAVTAVTNVDDLAERMARALATTGKIIEGRATEVKTPVGAVRPPPDVTTPHEVSAEHMKRPMTKLDTNRLRRI